MTDFRTVATRVLGATLAAILLASCISIAGKPVAADLPDEGETTVAAPSGGSATGEPTSSELIAAGLAAGEIDEPTSLLYRTWALFGDPQLPGEFAGAAESHDLGLIVELRERLGDLPADIAAGMEPYLLRPSDARSAFSTDAPGLRARNDAVPRDDRAQCRGWQTEAVIGTPFRIWGCADENAAVPLDTAMALMELVIVSHSEEMIADMGEPIPDAVGGADEANVDDLIDIYLLPNGWLGPQRSGGVADTDYAITMGVQPSTGVTLSAYVLISSDYLGDPGLFERMLVHEMFHVLQYAHHARLGDRWFYEASAEWAAAYYARPIAADLHAARLPLIQDEPGISLTSSVGKHPYGAYVWPLFMEQQIGAQAVFDTWRALAALPQAAREQAVIGVLNDHLPVGDSFPTFVRRLFNANLGGDPIQPRFVDLDESFPDGRRPATTDLVLDDEPLTIKDMAGTPGLGYRFHRISVPDSDEPVMVTVSGDLATGSGSYPVLEALIRGGTGDYRLQRLAYGGDGDDVCVVGEMILLLSNTSTERADTLDGTVTVARNGEQPDCMRVEVTHPESMAALLDDEVVEVDDIEDDGEPGTAPVMISVMGVQPDEVDDHRVQVTVDGPTLQSARQFDWPLGDFEPVADDLYRKAETIALDRDLTDERRPLHISARLIADGDTAGEHAATATLRGQQPCDPDGDGQKCILAGTLTFGMSGQHSRSIRVGTNHFEEEEFSADVDATIQVRLQDMPSGPSYPRRHWGDAGSTWEVRGSTSYRYCGPDYACDATMSQQFETDDGDDGAQPSLIALVPYPDGLGLYLQLPVREHNAVSGAHGRPPQPIEHRVWHLGCPAMSQFRSSYFWGRDTAPRFDLPGIDWTGDWLRWTESGLRYDQAGTALIVDCHRDTTDNNESLTWKLTGTLRWITARE